jgi:hypothetical protein
MSLPEATHTYKFDLTLEFPEDLDVRSDVLLKTIVDAIHAYDTQKRLLPGSPVPACGERLIGSSIGSTGYEGTRNRIASSERLDMPKGYHASSEEADEIIRLSVAIDRRVEELEDVQAELWQRYEPMVLAVDDAEITKLRKASARAIKKASAVLQKSHANGASGE